MSQYTVAALVGSVIDRHGPSICSLIGACLFSCGFGSFAFEVHNALNNLPAPSQTTFYRFVFCFLLAGLGTVFSWVLGYNMILSFSNCLYLGTSPPYSLPPKHFLTILALPLVPLWHSSDFLHYSYLLLRQIFLPILPRVY